MPPPLHQPPFVSFSQIKQSTQLNPHHILSISLASLTATHSSLSLKDLNPVSAWPLWCPWTSRSCSLAPRHQWRQTGAWWTSPPWNSSLPSCTCHRAKQNDIKTQPNTAYKRFTLSWVVPVKERNKMMCGITQHSLQKIHPHSSCTCHGVKQNDVWHDPTQLTKDSPSLELYVSWREIKWRVTWPNTAYKTSPSTDLYKTKYIRELPNTLHTNIFLPACFLDVCLHICWERWAFRFCLSDIPVNGVDCGKEDHSTQWDWRVSTTSDI